MRHSRLAVAACAALAACTAACTAPSRPPFAHEASDAGAMHELDATTDASDAGAGASDGGTIQPLVLPDVVPAVRTPEMRNGVECTRVPGVTSFYAPPSLHVIDATVYVFSVDASEQTPRVLMHLSPLEPLAFGEPTTLLHGGHEVDLIAQGQTLRALVGRQFYTVELVSSDGLTFEEVQQVGPHEPTYNCEGYPPPRYFRGRQPAQLMVAGSDYNTGLFGCYERVFVARREGELWAEPIEVGRGDVVFAHQGVSHASIVTTLGVLQSRDDGETFDAITGLDAAGGAFTGQRLVLARAAADGLRALSSEDEGASWSAQTLVLPDQAYSWSVHRGRRRHALDGGRDRDGDRAQHELR